VQLETCRNSFLLEGDCCCLRVLTLTGSCFSEVHFTPDPLCFTREERWLLVVSPVGTEISLAVEENRGEILAGELGLAVLVFLAVRQLVSDRRVRLSVELQAAQV